MNATDSPRLLAGVIDPAWASPVNLIVLVLLCIYLARELRLLRKVVLDQARLHHDQAVELARTAKGSEERARAAAAEIAVTARAVRDHLKLAALYRRDAEDLERRGLIAARFAHDRDADAADTPPHGMPILGPLPPPESPR